MEPDFSGYATKAGLRCSDGRTITAEAFKQQDGMTLPLVWQHGHDTAENVLGHVDLEARDDGMYCYGYFNGTSAGQHAKEVVEHKDVNKLSIWANDLVERSKQVIHGKIREVSLVLAGANPGAEIDFVRIAHSDDRDDDEVLSDEAIIYTGLELEHADKPKSKIAVEDEPKDDDDDSSLKHAAGDDEGQTVQEIYDSLTDVQKDVVNYLIGAALEEAGTGSDVSHSDLGPDAEPQAVYDALNDGQKAVVHSMIEDAKERSKKEAIAEHSALIEKEGTTVNVFESQAQNATTLRHAAMTEARKNLTPERISTLVSDGERFGSLKESFIAHADEYGITDIDLLFPDATLDQNGISIISRRMEWVQNVLSGTRHSPFSRVKSLSADITADEARARGYVKGNMKKDEVIKLLRRITTPKTIYKKQKLDRDDIVDITDLDIVAWLKAEMRVMLDEELARAVLIGDGRDADDDDKIDEDAIRPIAYDVDMYTTRVNLDASNNAPSLVDQVVVALDSYKGTGTPTLYTTQRKLTEMLLSKDGMGRRFYPTKADLANALLVQDVVAVEAMEQDPDLIGVIVNLADYTIGADAGGAVAMFDDFDIDFNQQKYLIETRVSGALTKPKSAIALFLDSGHIVTPTVPAFVSSTGVVTIPNITGVVYQNADTNTNLAPGAQTALAPRATLNVQAVPAAGYGFAHGSDTEYSFTRDAS